MRKFKVPLWVNLLYSLMDWVDYRILSRASSVLMNWRIRLLDHYCWCEKCQERERTGAV